MKRKFLLVCALLGVLTVSGCKNKKENIKPTLATPNQIDIVIDDGRSFIVFDEVPGAEYYNVSINGNIVTVRANGLGQIQFDASKLMNEPKEYVIKVNAGSKSHFDSEYTNEYIYSPDKMIDSPIVSREGTTLNWTPIAEADLYEVFVNTPNSSQSFKLTNNSFDFAEMLTACGEYTFYVIAISQNGQNIESLKSNDVIYTYIENFKTPHNLKVEYDYESEGEVLSFTSSENVVNFEIQVGINNQTYTDIINIDNTEYWKEDNFRNIYIFKIKKYIDNCAESNQIKIDSGSLLSVKVKAKASIEQQYLNSSEFSETLTYQVKSILEQPKILTSTSGSMCNLTIQAKDSAYLSQFAIYFNNREYKRIDSSITYLQIPLSVINNAVIRVQSISNNNNCYDSNLSNGKFEDGGSVNSMTLNVTGSTVSWGKIQDASEYWLEISNARYKKLVKINDINTISYDVASQCEPGKYSVKIIALGQTSAESSKIYVEFSNSLDAVTDLEFRSGTKLYFTPEPNADGYELTIKYRLLDSQQDIEKTIPYLFSASPIDVEEYLLEAQNYEFKLKAVDLLNKYVNDSESTDWVNYRNIKTLTAPELEVFQEGQEFYLKIMPKEDSALISGYEVWIDYVKHDDILLDETGTINITSYLQNAGLHNFMVKACAIDNEFLKDSSINSISHVVYKQLNNVKNIDVNNSTAGTYILSFDRVIMAGGYNINISKVDEDYSAEINSISNIVDISNYIRESGTYTICVKAVPDVDDEYYSESETSIYELTKRETLSHVTNIVIEKDRTEDEINLSWDSVENATYYEIKIYYNKNNSKVLKKEITAQQSTSLSVNLVSSENLAIDKEGSYIVEIRAIGDEIYESSSIITSVYNHQMETVGDFERNKLNVGEDSFTYKVEDAQTLKNLLWHHYLYNNQTWAYDTIDYNLKIYCDKDLTELAEQVEDVEEEVKNASTKVEKMSVLATALLGQYKELLSYNTTFGSSICVAEQGNIYIFSYQTNVGETQKTETTNKVYTTNVGCGEKLDVVDTEVSGKRLGDHEFAIDSRESVEVTTTEQLFIALQYNKKPNFVGNSLVAEAVYENARYVLRQICTDSMTDYEKVLNIYNFLTKRVAWNIDAESSLTNVNDNADMQELYLESILYNSSESNGLFTILNSENDSNNLAVSDLNEFVGISSLSQGISKAFVVLCSIEGIDSIKINGTLEGKDYSWNKVYIDANADGTKEWYAIDLGAAIKNAIEVNENQYQVGSHQYFLIKDIDIDAIEINHHHRLGDISYNAVTEFNYYSSQEYQIEYNSVEYTGNMTVSNGADIKEFIKYAMIYADNQLTVIDVDAKVYFDSFEGQLNIDSINSQINSLHGSAMQDTGLVYTMSFEIVDNRYIIFMFEPFVL